MKLKTRISAIDRKGEMEKISRRMRSEETADRLAKTTRHPERAKIEFEEERPLLDTGCLEEISAVTDVLSKDASETYSDVSEYFDSTTRIDRPVAEEAANRLALEINEKCRPIFSETLLDIQQTAEERLAKFKDDLRKREIEEHEIPSIRTLEIEAAREVFVTIVQKLRTGAASDEEGTRILIEVYNMLTEYEMCDIVDSGFILTARLVDELVRIESLSTEVLEQVLLGWVPDDNSPENPLDYGSVTRSEAMRALCQAKIEDLESEDPKRVEEAKAFIKLVLNDDVDWVSEITAGESELDF